MTQMSTADILKRYLFVHGRLGLPGIGSLKLVRVSAKNDFALKTMYPPFQQIHFIPEEPDFMQLQFQRLAVRIGKTEAQAASIIKDWISEFCSGLGEVPFHWEGVGTFSKSVNGKLEFIPDALSSNGLQPVAYTHIVREKIEHTVKVGEDERTNVEMEHFFDEQKKAANAGVWVKASLVLIILSLLFVFYRFTLGGFDVNEPRYNRLLPSAPLPTYRTP